MNVRQALWNAARIGEKRALPLLSFPASKPMGVSVEQLVRSAALQARAMEYVALRTDAAACVSLMDLSVEAEALGARVRYSPDEVPAVVGRLLESAEAVDSLAIPAPDAARAGVCLDAIRLAKKSVTDRPVLAGMIGPFSLAGRLMDVTEILYACYDEPETVEAALEKATAFLIRYGEAFRQAGADGIVLAEPLAGLLSADMMQTFSAPYVRQIVSSLQTEPFAIVYHNCGNTLRMLPEIFSQGAAAYHFGNAVRMPDVLQAAPGDALCMGNIDPVAQFTLGTPASIREDVLSLLTGCGGASNFILSSGCDIPANANWDNIDAFFSALNEDNHARR